MNTRAGLSIGAVLLLAFGAAAAAEPAIDEIVVTAKVVHSSPAQSDEIVAELKDALPSAAPVVALPKIEIVMPQLVAEHG